MLKLNHPITDWAIQLGTSSDTLLYASDSSLVRQSFAPVQSDVMPELLPPQRSPAVGVVHLPSSLGTGLTAVLSCMASTAVPHGLFDPAAAVVTAAIACIAVQLCLGTALGTNACPCLSLLRCPQLQGSTAPVTSKVSHETVELQVVLSAPVTAVVLAAGPAATAAAVCSSLVDELLRYVLLPLMGCCPRQPLGMEPEATGIQVIAALCVTDVWLLIKLWLRLLAAMSPLQALLARRLR